MISRTSFKLQKIRNKKRIGRRATDWEKLFTKDTSDIIQIYKEYLKVSNKKKFNIKKCTKTLIDTSSKKIYRWQVSIRSTSHVTREKQIKTMRCHYTPIRIANINNNKIQNTDIIEYSWACGATGTLSHCWWECNVAIRKTNLVLSFKTNYARTLWYCC